MGNDSDSDCYAREDCVRRRCNIRSRLSLKGYLFALIVSNKIAGNEQDETMIGTSRQDRRIASTEHSMETVLCSTMAAWAI